MNSKSRNLLLGTLLLGQASYSMAALQSGTAQNFTFQWDDSFWSSVVATGNTLTFSALLNSVSALSPSGTGGTLDQNGYKVDYLSSNNHGAPVISLIANNGFNLNALNFGMAGHYSLTGTAEFGAEMGMYQYLVDVPHSTNFGAHTTLGSSSGNFSTGNLFSLGGASKFDGTAWFWGKTAALGADSSASLTLDSAYLAVNVSPVPEPETYAMMLVGLGFMGFAARRRQKA